MVIEARIVVTLGGYLLGGATRKPGEVQEMLCILTWGVVT